MSRAVPIHMALDNGPGHSPGLDIALDNALDIAFDMAPDMALDSSGAKHTWRKIGGSCQGSALLAKRGVQMTTAIEPKWLKVLSFSNILNIN